MEKTRFGVLEDGREVYEYVLESDCVRVGILTLGGIIHTWYFKGVDIIAGYDDLTGYLADTSHQGALIGRTCNRIKNGEFEIDGRMIRVSRNNGQNNLHGGFKGFDTKVWNVKSYDGRSLALTCESADGEEGYPGHVDVCVTYRLEGGALGIFYEAVSDKKTPISMTNHAYLNLEGYEKGGDIKGHVLRIDSSKRTEVDGSLIPTGKRIDVSGTHFDFRKPKKIGADWPDGFGGFDDNYMLDGKTQGVFFGQTLNHAATLSANGITLETYTDCPAMQLYIGCMLKGEPAMKGGVPKRTLSTVCLETQTEPNAVQRGEILHDAGEVYRSATVYVLK